MTEQGAVRVEEVPLGDPRIRDFVRFHWDHYRGNETNAGQHRTIHQPNLGTG